MARYSRRRRRYSRRKYNIENRPLSFSAPNTQENGYYQNQVEIVPATTIEGVRQVARMTITLTEYADTNYPVFWALVYIPEGVTTTSLFPSTTELFRPSNYVLATGVNDATAGPIRISSRLRKNLNAGDRIFLLTAVSKQATNESVGFIGLVRYAICYN